MLKKTLFIHDVDFLNDKKIIELSIRLWINIVTSLHQKCSEINNQGNWITPVNSFDDYSIHNGQKARKTFHCLVQQHVYLLSFYIENIHSGT